MARSGELRVTWLKRYWWAGYVAVVLLLAVSALLYARSERAVGEARQADRAAERADSARESALERARRDSARLDSVQAREVALRDSISVLLDQADEDATEAAGEVTVQTVALDSTLAELARRVPDHLVGLVTRAMQQADSLKGAHARFADAMERQVALLARDTVSLRRELDQTRTTLASTRTALRETESALEAMREARDRWRRAADPPLLEELFGRNLLSASATVASGVLAWGYSPEAGAGWTVGQVARVAF